MTENAGLTAKRLMTLERMKAAHAMRETHTEVSVNLDVPNYPGTRIVVLSLIHNDQLENKEWAREHFEVVLKRALDSMTSVLDRPELEMNYSKRTSVTL